MWAEVGRQLSAVGSWGSVIFLLVPVIVISGVIIIFKMADNSQTPEGEIRIRSLGILIRWNRSPRAEEKSESKSAAAKKASDQEPARLRLLRRRDKNNRADLGKYQIKAEPVTNFEAGSVVRRARICPRSARWSWVVLSPTYSRNRF
jgi:hypothetical protein